MDTYHSQGVKVMSKPSRLFTFLDEEHGFSYAVLDGRELIADLAIIHHIQAQGFDYFRNSVLTALPMISFFKPGEGFGIYIDSESPYFRLKIEANSLGQVRTLLIPEDFNDLPEKLFGQGRLSKIYNSAPYTSIIPLKGISFSEVVNSILKDSYQVQSEVRLISHSDFSILFMKLPPVNVNKITTETTLSLPEYWMKYQAAFHQILSGDPEEAKILKGLKGLGHQHLASREIRFTCPCSKERMILSLKGLRSTSFEELFEEGKDTLETKCDYCKKVYLISRDELKA